MKVGMITWWRYNYGSILQAYALQNKLNELGVDSEIICQYGKKTVSMTNFKEKIKRIGIRKTAKRVFWKFGSSKLRSRNKNIESFINENLKVSNQEYNELNIKETNKLYDTFLCGSDQIWNPKLTEFDSMYWLNFVDDNKSRISYAPSMGVSSLDIEDEKKLKINLTKFKSISTREESSTKMINNILKNNSCQTVLDPTLLVEKKVWDKFKSKIEIKNKYIFVYMLRGTKQQRKLIESFAKKKGLQIVTMPFLDNEKISLYDLKFGDVKVWDADPKDFISLIRNAEYVFTDSFHSMVFSTIYHIPFYTFPKIGKAQVNRIIDFQKMINVKDRMISKETDINKIESIEKIDWNKVDEIIKSKRKESKYFLVKSLEK